MYALLLVALASLAFPTADGPIGPKPKVTSTFTGPVTVGAPSTWDITAVAPAGYTLDAKYPFKFKPTQSHDITIPDDELDPSSRDAGRVSFNVPFIAVKAGKARLAGVLSISICEGATCIPDKVLIEATVDVK